MRTKWSGGLLVSLALLLGACGSAHDDVAVTERPATVVAVKGTNTKRVTLTAKAATRLGIETVAVRALRVAGRAPRMTIPYAGLIYAPSGKTSVYTNPEPLVFVKQPVTVDEIKGNVVVISAGPPVGTHVVTVGAEELFGIESGIGGFE